MAPEMSPDSIRDTQFRTVIRGADAAAVAQFQHEVANRVAELEELNERLTTRLGEFADRDLKSEFEVVGNEVTAVLEAAREAAESMRERASLDSSRWRSEAMAEAERVRKDARNDAEALRGDAWTVGSEMLNQAVAEANRLRSQAERDAITITGEAERDAHRLVSNARREAEDTVRSATMDAEKLTADGTKAHDDMIEQARRQAEASQERTRALEQRREELMAELEGVRTTLSHLEGTLEAKREDLNLSRTADSSVRVVPAASGQPAGPPADHGSDWVPGETVRVVRSDEPHAESHQPIDPPAIEPQKIPPAVTIIPAPVSRPAQDEPVEQSSEQEPSETEAVPPHREPAPEATPSGEGGSGDDVGALFASLREPLSTPPPRPKSGVASGGDAPRQATTATKEKGTSSRDAREADELVEARDGLLLPITNRALRGIKKAITEAQNVALDGLRTDPDWQPDEAQLTETLRADLIGLWSESFSAGHDMAESVTGEKLKRPPTPADDAPDGFVGSLVESLQSELGSAGSGQRERQSAASRVFRAWRTDEAERRIRHVALRAFHAGLAKSASGRQLDWVASGTPCSACLAAAANPSANLPPIHPGCECIVVVARR